ncbi:hypothetical protein KY289_027347 [Solanum tuberosum]|nr:hypothetical protein KY289_027347 [Solanum tuberosum]
MSAKGEVEESRALVEYNGSASIINETGLQVYSVVKMTRAKLDDSFEAVTDLKRLSSTRLFDIDFDSDMKERTTYSGTKMQPLLADSPIRAITCKAGNRICSSLTTENPFLETMLCNICCIDGFICGHVSLLECALRAYMAGTAGGSIKLDA